MLKHSLSNWRFLGRTLLPVVQGGMGVGISAHRLAGSVAAQGAMGTIASVDLRHHHPDLLAESEQTKDESELTRINCVALDREIQAAKALSQGEGAVAVNVMKAVAAHADYVRQACASGADAVVMGAGLPMDLPDMTQDFPHVGLIPILSESRGITLVLKKWMKKNRLPAAIVIEHPAYAGGHLGAPNPQELNHERFDFRRVVEETLAVFRQLDLEQNPIPLIVAGGLASHEKVKQALSWGASAVQIGTAFAVTQESDAHINFKQVLAEAGREQIVEFMSVAGLPARAVLTPWLKNYLNRESRLQSHAKADPSRCTQGLNCLSTCGLRDGLNKVGQFCIDLKLAAALRGDVNRGLFFRGAGSLPFGEAVRSVAELLDYLLNGNMPADWPSETQAALA